MLYLCDYPHEVSEPELYYEHRCRRYAAKRGSNAGGKRAGLRKRAAHRIG